MGVKVRKPKGHTAWCVVIDHQGQRKTKAVGSREAAERVRREIEARLALGGVQSLEPVKPALPTLSEYAKQWLANVEYERKPSTAGFYGQYLRLYVLPRFGANSLDRIDRDSAKRFIAELREKKLSKNTIRLAVTTLRAVLSAAVEDRWIAHNPVQGLGRFVKSEKAEHEAVSLTTDEVGRLLKTTRETLARQDYVLILTALRAGLRQGELAALRWGDVQFGRGPEDIDRFLLVQRNYDRRWSKKMLTPKSGKPRRVDMSCELRQALLDLLNDLRTSATADLASDFGVSI